MIQNHYDFKAAGAGLAASVVLVTQERARRVGRGRAQAVLLLWVVERCQTAYDIMRRVA